jgi:hypothetical protein
MTSALMKNSNISIFAYRHSRPNEEAGTKITESKRWSVTQSKNGNIRIFH